MTLHLKKTNEPLKAFPIHEENATSLGISVQDLADAAYELVGNGYAEYYSPHYIKYTNKEY